MEEQAGHSPGGASVQASQYRSQHLPTQLFIRAVSPWPDSGPLEWLGLWPGREEGWYEVASGFLWPSPLSLIFKEKGGDIKVSHRELKGRTVFVSNSLEGQGRLQASGRELDKTELIGPRDWNCGDVRQGCGQRSAEAAPHGACGQGLRIQTLP